MEALDKQFRMPRYLMRLIRDYLRNRSLVYNTTGRPRTKEITDGVQQGSVLGPDLWNVTYDSLLRTEMLEGTPFIAYADDFAELVSARTVDLAQMQFNRIMKRLSEWMRKHHLSLALAKTDILILMKRRIEIILPMTIDEECVMPKPAVKYMGVILDAQASFVEQNRRTAG